MKRALDQSDAIVEEFQADGNALSDALAEVSDDRDHIVREASALAQKNKQLEAKLAANNVVGTLETDDFRERLARVAKEKHDAELELRSVRSSLCKALGDTTTQASGSRAAGTHARLYIWVAVRLCIWVAVRLCIWVAVRLCIWVAFALASSRQLTDTTHWRHASLRDVCWRCHNPCPTPCFRPGYTCDPGA